MARQGSGSAIAGLIFVGISAVLILQVQAADYPVGGGNGTWTVPSVINVNYTTWAATNNYFTGDHLIFNYEDDNHNVLRVTPEKYAACDTSNPIQKYDEDDGTTNVELNDAGDYYFICGFPNHCPAGQKFMVSVQTNPNSGSAPKVYGLMLGAAATFGSILFT